MAEDPAPAADAPSPLPPEETPASIGSMSRKEKRKSLKKLKRKKIRQEAAIRAREEEEARSNDPEQQRRLKLEEAAAAEAAERARREFEEREKLWIEAAAARKKAEEEVEKERRRKEKLLQESSEIDKNRNTKLASELEDAEWDYVEEGPAEIIWQGNEIIVKKKRVKVAKRSSDRKPNEEDVDRPTSNPLPPQSAAFASYRNVQSGTAQEAIESVAQQVPNFGTEQDKAHCPFHLKTGVCRFGPRCSRAHLYPDKSCTFLIKNMYNGPGLAWEQDEGLEYTDEEVERSFEEFYEDVHTEFLKFGELVNFKVCKNGSYHLRGNVYVHYKFLESAILAYNNMNGRFFAGKQITCEFVGLTKWKVAICGEYMRSRFKTCSHGTACNFMHCFCNPGGDYEWADWDNPPPRYWIKKMTVLFGPSDESANAKKMELEDCERSRRRKQSYFLDRSRSPYEKIEVDDSSSGREDSNRKRDHCSSRKEHSSGNRRRKSFQDKHEQYEENHNFGPHDYTIKRSHHIHDSGEDYSLERDRDFLGKHRKIEKSSFKGHTRHEKKHRTEDSSEWRKRGSFFDVQEKSERSIKSKSHKHNKIGGLSDQNSDYPDKNGVPEDKSYSRHEIVAQDRYNGRNYSTDSDSGGDKKSSQHIKRVHKRKETDLDGRENFNDSSSGGDEKGSRHIKRARKRRESDYQTSERSTAKTTFNSELGNENWKSRKQEPINLGFSTDASPKGRDITDTYLSSEETCDRSSSRSSKKHKSGRKQKHQKEKKRQDVCCSGSGEELDMRVYRKRSRS